jgi:hypothetical protein
MPMITVHGGDFKKGASFGEGFCGPYLTLRPKGEFWGKTFTPDTIETIEVVTEEKAKKALGTLGGAAIGTLILPGIGTIAGLILGGNKQETMALIKFKDERQVLVTMKTKNFQKLYKSVLSQSLSRQPKVDA